MKVTLASGTEITYSYDGMNRRIGRTETHKYLYGNLGNLYQITATIEPDGMRSTYYYDTDGLLFAIERGGVRYYVTTDQVGSPKLVVNSTGAVVKVLDFDSFGNLLSDSNPAFYLPIGFAGGIADTDTELIRFGFRDYDSAAGRWTAKDLIFFDAGQGNLYGYCQNNPANFNDPSGMFIAQVIGGAIGMAFGVASAIKAGQGGSSIARSAAIGFGTGVLSTLGGGLVAGAIMGGGAGFLSNALTQTGSCFDWKSAGLSAAAGAIGGLVGGGLASATTKQSVTTLKELGEGIVGATRQGVPYLTESAQPRVARGQA